MTLSYLGFDRILGAFSDTLDDVFFLYFLFLFLLWKYPFSLPWYRWITNPRSLLIYHLQPIMSALGREFSKRRNGINIFFLRIQSLFPLLEKNLEDGLGIMPQSPATTQGFIDHQGSQCCAQKDTSAFVLTLWFPQLTAIHDWTQLRYSWSWKTRDSSALMSDFG